jgi:hypothetical protein
MMSMKLDRVLMTDSLSLSFRLEEISLALLSRMAQASSFVWLDFEELDAEGDACVGVLVASCEGADEEEGEDVGLSGLICRQAAIPRGIVAIRRAATIRRFMGYSLKS